MSKYMTAVMATNILYIDPWALNLEPIAKDDSCDVVVG